MPNKDAQPQFGPAMQALTTDRMRNFIVYLYSEEAPRHGRLKWAVEKAGYKTDKHNVASATANRLVNDRRVKAAAAEYAQSVVRALAPHAIESIREILSNKKSKFHFKAIEAVMDRVDPIERGPLVRIENNNNNVTVQTTDKIFARIRFLAAKHNFDADALLAGQVPHELLDVRQKMIAAKAVEPPADADPS